MIDLNERQRHQVVVIGGGFGGLETVRRLKKADVDVTLIDRRNFHLFQPLLYQVATGGLSPANIAAPLRSIFGKQKNCRILLGEVTGFDLEQNEVILQDDRCRFDTLVVAAGASPSYFGNDSWQKYAPPLKSIEDATAIRSRLFWCFEQAEREACKKDRCEWLTFVIVGGGPTGVELAGALAEISRHTLVNDFRSIDPSEARIILVEAGDQVLSSYPPDLTSKAESKIRQLGIELRTKTQVTEIKQDYVEVEHVGSTERIATYSVIWAAGVKANPLGGKLAQAANCKTDRMGRVLVSDDLTLSTNPSIFVIGDLAYVTNDEDNPLPGIAPVAIQQAKFVAKLIQLRQSGRKSKDRFHYRDLGSMATIGRKAAIAEIGKFKFSGIFAWWLWLAIHLMQIVQFQNRVLILIQWAYSYLTYNRAARLITHPTHNDNEADTSKAIDQTS
ncbi:MAG: NAD(P)/FAD-dependent oxidoreductase [Planctomycetaceae bacterium]|nr:NAD(P)/FAD-dependent oxidoreductase [Planctomycetaceae bacterium]